MNLLRLLGIGVAPVFGVQPAFVSIWLEVFEKFGRGEWIRTTDLLVPNQATLVISMITEQIFSQETSF